MSENEIAESIGWMWTDWQATPDRHTEWTHSAEQRALMWIAAFQHLSDWWRKIDGGPFACTASGLAWSHFRARLRPKTCLAHTNERAKEIELYAQHGGRTGVWYHGTIGRGSKSPDTLPLLPHAAGEPEIAGPVACYDVRSMYPHLLATRQFPVKLLSCRENPSLEYVRDALRERAVIAHVRLTTEVAEYPLRTRDRILYPTGQFMSYLAGPELERALADGTVSECLAACVYATGTPFAVPASELLAERNAALERGNPGHARFCKILSNSLGGRLSLRAGCWKPAPEAWPELQWGEWSSVHAQTNVVKRYKAYAGLVWQWHEQELSGRPMGAAYAYLTSYGRMMMREIREKIPARRIVQQDTDGLWILPGNPLVDEVVTLPTGDRPGDMRLDYESGWGRWYSPKHYVTARGWITSGLHHPVPIGDTARFTETHTNDPLWRRRECPDPVIYSTLREISLSGIDRTGWVDNDGWVTPYRHIGGRIQPRPASQG